MNTISVHTLFKNEDRFLWYSVQSVIDYVDKLLLWDTGSTDDSVLIAKELKHRYPNKIDLKLVGEVNPEQFREVRADMLSATNTDWFMVVDADEVWWEKSIRDITDFIRQVRGLTYESVFVPSINMVGDIFHYQDESAGNYQIAGKKGHLGLRGINRMIPGLSSTNPHGTWGWSDKDKKMIQDRSARKIKFIHAPYMHMTFLQRSHGDKGDLLVPKRKKKLKYEMGIEVAKNYYYPESFFRERPSFVRSPWCIMKTSFKKRAVFETPLKKIKRKLLTPGVGY
ncbi:glycosyltransferase family 2 protein [Candidatus Woesebacteria bacterium]|nr:MAG: glycosyltransferase family 2 protein [Candidatus Woesebacteria bacterium]